MGFFDSKSSTTQQTYQYDNRVAATDSAIVGRDGSTINVLDGGALEIAKELGLTALASNELIAREAVSQARVLGGGALNAIADNADKAFEFVDKQRQEVRARTIREIVPWLVGGVSVAALTYYYRSR